jgi:hypothetical protein
VEILVTVDKNRQRRFNCDKYVLDNSTGTPILEVKKGGEVLAVFKTFDFVEKVQEVRNDGD